MTAAKNISTGWARIGTQSAIPPGSDAPLQANTDATAPAGGQAVYYDASANVALDDGTHPGLLAAGFCDDKEAPTVTTAAALGIRLWQGFVSLPLNGTSSDAVLATSIMVPVWDGGNGVPCVRSSDGTNDRPFLGVALGLDGNGFPIIWGGPIAQSVARSLHSVTNDSSALYQYAADASASTDQGSLSGSALATIGFVIPRPKRREIITAVDIVPRAALSSAGTNYRQIKLWKVDTTGTVAVASSPLVATFTTESQALVAGQPTAWTLGAAAALVLRETDILVGTSVATASGATVPQSAIRAHSKVL